MRIFVEPIEMGETHVGFQFGNTLSDPFHSVTFNSAETNATAARKLRALADMLDAPGTRERAPVEPEVGEVVERGPAIDAEPKFGHTNLDGF